MDEGAKYKLIEE